MSNFFRHFLDVFCNLLVLNSVRWNKIPKPEALGNFELLLDEELASHEELHTSASSQSGKGMGKSSSTRWK